MGGYTNKRRRLNSLDDFGSVLHAVITTSFLVILMGARQRWCQGFISTVVLRLFSLFLGTNMLHLVDNNQKWCDFQETVC